MGSCYSVPFFIEEKVKEEEKCLICWDSVSLNSIYIKCCKCNIYLHENCACKYKENRNKDLKNNDCPHCKCKNSLYRYDNDIYDCKNI